MTCQPLTQTIFSPRRGDLCSRENAHRVAERALRTPAPSGRDHPYRRPDQDPFHVTDEAAFDAHIEVELRA